MAEFNSLNDKAPFNMAINTLERLGEILTNIRRIEQEPLFTIEMKQEYKINLVKQFFIQASPLMFDHAPDRKAEIQQKVLVLEPKRAKVIQDGKRTNKERVIFSSEIDKQLNEILIEIQDVLQQGKFYMPPRKYAGHSVGDFG